MKKVIEKQVSNMQIYKGVLYGEVSVINNGRGKMRNAIMRLVDYVGKFGELVLTPQKKGSIRKKVFAIMTTYISDICNSDYTLILTKHKSNTLLKKQSFIDSCEVLKTFFVKKGENYTLKTQTVELTNALIEIATVQLTAYYDNNLKTSKKVKK